MAGPKHNTKRSRDPSSSSNHPSKKFRKDTNPKHTPKPASNASVIPDSKVPSRATISSKTSALGNSAPVLVDSIDLSAYDVTSISILSSSAIQQRITRILSLLQSKSSETTAQEKEAKGTGKQCVVKLHANAKAASKLISVVEIAKRELGADGGKWLQYNSVEGVIKEKPAPEQKISSQGKENRGEEKEIEENEDGEEVDHEEDEEEVFETMKTPFERSIEGVPKIRKVPVLTIWLSRSRVDGLARRFGEQSNTDISK